LQCGWPYSNEYSLLANESGRTMRIRSPNLEADWKLKLGDFSKL